MITFEHATMNCSSSTTACRAVEGKAASCLLQSMATTPTSAAGFAMAVEGSKGNLETYYTHIGGTSGLSCLDIEGLGPSIKQQEQASIKDLI